MQMKNALVETQMTYIVSGGALNSTHSYLRHSTKIICNFWPQLQI